jgi:hypothetical protein
MPSSVAVEGSSAWTVPAPSAIKLDAQARARCVEDPQIFLSDPDPGGQLITDPDRTWATLWPLEQTMLAKCIKSFKIVKY